MTPCWFCGRDAGDGVIGHISGKPEETGIVAYCGECEPVTEHTKAVTSPKVFEILMKKAKERHGES
jgi:hypothetical protein